MGSSIHLGPFPRQERERLGFTEHAGCISKMTALLSSDELPGRSIDPLFVAERRHWLANRKSEYSAVNLDLKAEPFRVEGRLAQHVDCVRPEDMTLGLIVEAQDDFELNSWGERIAARPGDAFLLDPHRNHGAETEGHFTFLAFEVGRMAIPKRDRLKAIFLADLALICGAIQ